VHGELTITYFLHELSKPSQNSTQSYVYINNGVAITVMLLIIQAMQCLNISSEKCLIVS
jgi:hypothetical protein